MTILKFLAFALLFPIAYSAQSQTYLLLDRRWKKDAILTDTVTHENLSKGSFPIYNKDLDELINMTSKFKNLKDDGMKRKFYFSEEFKAENFEFQIENIRRAFGDGYEINLISKGSFGTPILKLSDPRNNLPQNELVIRDFLKYLEKTKRNLSK